MKKFKRIISMALALVMIIGILPISSLQVYALDKSDSSTELENLYAKVSDRNASGWDRKDCDPKFDPATKRYTIAVEQNYSDIYFYIGWAKDGQVVEAKMNGNALTLKNAANGFTTDTKYLNNGSTEFAFKVTSKDNTKSDTYYVTVIKGDVANLRKITVKNGKANKTMAFAGDYINIYADPAPAGKVFDIWQSDKNDISFTRIADASTGFTMPNRDVTVEAIYKTDPETSAELDNILAKVKKSSTSWETKDLNPIYDRATKSYTLTVDKDYTTAYFFLKWDDKDQTIVAKKDGVNLNLDTPLSSGYETLSTDLTKLETVFTFEVTSKDKKNTNTYTVKVKRGNATDLYNVDVVNGTANPNPAYVGDTVYIDANTAPQGQVFDYWKKDGTDIVISNPKDVSTSFTMPARNVRVEAIYKIDPEVSAELMDIKAYVSSAGIGAWDTFSVTPKYDRVTKEYTLAIPNKYNKIYFFLAWDDEGQKIVAKKDGVDLGFSDKLSTGYNTNNAGLTDKASVYTFEVTSKDGKNTNTYKVTVTREASPLTPVNIPTAITNLVYTGNPQTGVNEGTGYTLTGNIETNAGTYTAKATLKAGYKWSDGSTEVKNITWTIAKARPTYTEPENLIGKKGDKLSTVVLPAQFKWKNGDIRLDTVGVKTYYAVFTPADPANYEVIDVNLTVTVEEVAHKITVVNGTSSVATAKQGDSVTVTATVPADKEFDAWEVTGITLTDVQKKENPLTIKMPDNDITLTASFKDKELIEIDLPVSTLSFVYDGTEKVAIQEGTGYTVTNHKATDAGEYKATVTLQEGYKWKKFGVKSLTYDWKIEKADPTYTVPTGLKGKKGEKLSTVSLTDGFTWVDGEEVLDTVGVNTFKAKFTPDDTNNYKEVEVDIKVLVEEVTPPAPTVTAISVNSTNHKTDYKVGEDLDLTNLTIEVTKSDGSKETVNVDKSMVTGFDSSTANPNQELTITYEGKTTTYTIKIEEVAPPTPTVTAIKVNSTSHKTDYKVGDELDVTNLTIEVIKSDGSKETVNVESFMVTGFDSSAANPSQELTITYFGKTATYTIKIEEVTPPTSKTYTIKFDNNGGSGTMDDVVKNEGDKYSLPACTFTAPTNKEFKAWLVGSEEKAIGEEIIVNDNITIKAVWKDKSVTPPTPPTPPTPGITPNPWGPRYEYNPFWQIYFGSTEQIAPKQTIKEKTEVVITIGSKIMERTMNGVNDKIMMDIAPFIEENRTMLPIRFVAEALGFKVEWISETRTVVLTNRDNVVKIPVDTNQIIVNGKVFESDVKPVLKDNRTMLPVANIARALGLKDGTDILWDETTKKVTIIREQIID